MGTNYPTSLDTTTNLPSSPDPFVQASTSGHLSHPPTVHGAVRGLETKVGVGASPASSAVDGQTLQRNADGTTSWLHPRVLNTDSTSTDYTLTLSDVGRAREMAATTSTTVRIPTSAVAGGWPAGACIMVSRLNTGSVTISANAGVTIRTAATLILRTQNSVATLRYRGSDEWIAYGDFQ